MDGGSCSLTLDECVYGVRLPSPTLYNPRRRNRLEGDLCGRKVRYTYRNREATGLPPIRSLGSI